MVPLRSIKALATRFIQPLICGALIGAILLASYPAFAELTVNIFNPNRVASTNSTETFMGTITNNTGVTLDAVADMFLNFNGFDSGVVSLTQLLGSPDFSLPDGITSAPVDLFTFTLGPGAVANQMYFADVTLEDSRNDISNTVTVSETVRVPEPGTMLLLGTGLVACALGYSARRRRLTRLEKGRLMRTATRLAVSVSVLALLTCLALPQSAFGQASPVQLVTGQPGRAVESPNKLLVALPVFNAGTADAANVQVQSITLTSAAPLIPAAFPVGLGTIPMQGSATLNASFDSSGLVAGTPYRLTVGGTYVFGGMTFGFTLNRSVTLPPLAPGSSPVRTISVPPNVVTGAPFPPDTINFPPEVNPPGPPAPIGQFRGTGGPTNSSNQISFSPQQSTSSGESAANADAAVTFFVNTAFGSVVSFSGVPPDMSGASGTSRRGTVVFTTGNTFAAYSIDGGQTFTSLNPTTIFPNRDSAGNLIDGGLCCDQVVQYVPSINRFVWLMQFWRATRPTDTPCPCPPGTGPTGPNRLRIAVASPEDIINSGGTAWTYWDLTSGIYGFGNNWMDYPDMSVGNNSLYISVDVVGVGFFISRIPLSQLQASTTINIDFTNPADSAMAYGGHVIQNPGDEVHWAGHNSTSSMRIFSLVEGSGSYSWQDLDINSWCNLDYSSLMPNGVNWLGMSNGFPGSGIIGGTRRDLGGIFGGASKELWFAWMAGRGQATTPLGCLLSELFRTGFPQSHIELVRIDASNPTFSLMEQNAIWNPTIAFGYPSLTTNLSLEIALSLGFGGGGFYATHAVGFWGDFVVYTTSNNDTGISRWGDYVTVRPASPNPDLLSATGFGTLAATGYNPTYTLFGRPPVPPPR